MKPGDTWTCKICQTEVVCDEWGIRHSTAGHSINFRKEYAEQREKGVQIDFSKQEFDAVQPTKKDEQLGLF